MQVESSCKLFNISSLSDYYKTVFSYLSGGHEKLVKSQRFTHQQSGNYASSQAHRCIQISFAIKTPRENLDYYKNNLLKLKSSFTKVKRIIPEKITQQVLAIQCRHKKQCTNCQGHEEMKLLLKQKLKEQLQRTRQTERNKESRTLGLEAIGKLCRHGRIIYSSLKYRTEKTDL